MKYIYAGSRAMTLQNELLGETELDMLLSAKSFSEAYNNLNETFLARYIAKKDPEELPYILENVVLDTKKILSFIAPEPEILDILWLKYDFYNLSALIKGSKKGLSNEEMLELCFKSGKYDPEVLLEKYKENDLKKLNYYLMKAERKAKDHKEVSDIDRVMNISYLESIRYISEKNGNEFAKKYTSLIIDIFNIQANLRALSYGAYNEAPYHVFVSGGNLRKNQMEDEEELLKALFQKGKSDSWKEAADEYRKTGSYALIEKTCDEYLIEFLKRESFKIFSPAPLFLYFQAVKNNVQVVRTILVSKYTGMSEYDLRRILRKLYV